ncbi:PcfJ domain-containing protein [Mesobacillus subterraneus]|uniref:PcfJ domain-containing protein n=1 Tax=Mesobacillus subterraneus TaxID=285983 RepID=UPI001CFD25A2|nr:PcfJ domain-containing protein [Mesobacillus subterraneus]WLR54854.1 PcfJ domain-containing protein [Mesobacillus subterraneus]
MAQDRRFERFSAHFSDEIGPGLKEFVVNDALLHSRYFFVKRVTSTIQRGFCTHCQKDYMVSGSKQLTHNEDWKCQHCQSLVLVKQAGRGRGKLLDEAYVIWYEKSLADPVAITATGYRVSMDYRENYKGETTYYPVTRYVFEKGKVQMMYRNNYAGVVTRKVQRYDGWSFANKPWTMIGKAGYTRNSKQSIESILKAVEGTFFKYGEWTHFANRNIDSIYFFSKFAKYPFIEYLWKMGMGELVKAMVEDHHLYRSVNMRGKTMEKILGLSKAEIKEWKASNIIMTPLLLHNYKWFRDRRVQIDWATAQACDHLLTGSYYQDKLNFILKHSPSLARIMKYALSQMKKDTKRYYSVTSLITNWKDYLDECIELKMDIKQESILMPNNLHKAHQKTTRAIKIKNDEVINKKIALQQRQLDRYRFEKDGLLIRPAVSSIEMFDEGENLNHCVGRYADRYAKGEIVIMFIRKADQPEKSYYTVELYRNTNEIVQCRGKNNSNPGKDVEKFLKDYKSEILSNKRKQKESKKSIRQEVAV